MSSNPAASLSADTKQDEIHVALKRRPIRHTSPEKSGTVLGSRSLEELWRAPALPVPPSVHVALGIENEREASSENRAAGYKITLFLCER